MSMWMFYASGDTPVQAWCEKDGAFVVPANSVVLYTTQYARRAWCVAHCPTCDSDVTHNLDGRSAMVRLLTHAGAKVEQVPEEAVEEHTGEVITEADIEAFLADLDKPLGGNEDE